jgi:hypothetical protein
MHLLEGVGFPMRGADAYINKSSITLTVIKGTRTAVMESFLCFSFVWTTCLKQQVVLIV